MSVENGINKVLITGGAGYVGAVLVPKLLSKGYHVKVLDLFIYGDDVLDEVKDHPNLEQIKGDIRDEKILREIIRDVMLLFTWLVYQMIQVLN